MREARALGWNATWGNQTQPEGSAANASFAAAQEPAANASSAQTAFTAQVANASLMDRYLAEEGLLRSNAAP